MLEVFEMHLYNYIIRKDGTENSPCSWLYKTLHPEDTEVTEDELSDITIHNIMTNEIYNDVGLDEQRKLHGRTRKAVTETIRICKDKNVLREYLEEREMEETTNL